MEISHGHQDEHPRGAEDQKPEGVRQLDDPAERLGEGRRDALDDGADTKEPRPSKLSFCWERFSKLIDVAGPMIVRHHEAVENGRFGLLDLDFQAYLTWENLGFTRVWTARDGEGTLVGYMLWVCHVDTHHRTKVRARCDSTWLEPAWREGLEGYRMMKEAVAALKSLKIDHIYLPLPVNGSDQRLELLYRRLGFKPSEMVWELLS